MKRFVFSLLGLIAICVLSFRMPAVDAQLPAMLFARTSVTAYNTQVGADGVTNYWRLGEASGTSAVDSGPANNPGTISAVTTYGVRGPLGDGSTALSWDGAATGGKVAITPAASTTTCTIEFWFKPTGASGDGAHNLLSNDPTNTAFVIYYSNGANAGKISVFYSGADHVSTSTLVVNQWYHIAISITAGNGTIYINGVSSGTFASYLSASYKSIGTGNSVNEVTNGALKDVALYIGTALTATQAANHYAARLANTARAVAVDTNGYLKVVGN